MSSGFDFKDINIDFFVGNSGESFFDILNACAAAADDHARLSCVNGKLYSGCLHA